MATTNSGVSPSLPAIPTSAPLLATSLASDSIMGIDPTSPTGTSAYVARPAEATTCQSPISIVPPSPFYKAAHSGDQQGSPSGSDRRNSTDSANSDGAPSELPPSYAEAPVPTDTTLYTFSQQSFNSMVLLPPPGSQNTRSPYHISVMLNCFIPSSSITVVRRGGEFGEYVGEFEMGLSEKKATVTVEGRQKLLSTVLTKDGSRFSGSFTYRFPSSNGMDILLRWQCRGPHLHCFPIDLPTSPKQQPLAVFMSPSLLPRADGGAPAPPALTLRPGAHRRPLMDHILVSALLIERRRLTPGAATTKGMWS